MGANQYTRAQIGQALECAYIESSELEEVIDNVLAMLAKARADGKVEALLEAAGEFQVNTWASVLTGGIVTRARNGQEVSDWLRKRAEQIRGT